MALCEHHKSPITYGAVALVILSFFFSFGSIVAVISGLVAILIVLGTICLRVPKAALYIAALAAIISSIGVFIVAAEPVCSANVVTNCNTKGFRIVKIIGGLLWIGSSVLIAKIPQRDATSNQATFSTSQTAGHETA